MNIFKASLQITVTRLSMINKIYQNHGQLEFELIVNKSQIYFTLEIIAVYFKNNLNSNEIVLKYIYGN